MGFWRRLLNRDSAGRTTSPDKVRPRTHIATPVEDLVEDPRERARALDSALSLAREFGFEPKREIIVDDVPFDELGGIAAFERERLNTLLQLVEEGQYLFPRVFSVDYEFVESNDAYAHVLREMAAAAGTEELLSEVHCDLHFGPDFARSPIGELRYEVAGESHSHDISSEGDWADPGVVSAMLSDVAPVDHVCVPANGASLAYWVPKNHAERFRVLITAEENAADARERNWRENQEHSN